MYRATTPKHTFIFDIDPQATFKEILITYSQNGVPVLNKTKADLTFGAVTTNPDGTFYNAYVVLTQEESNLFNAKSSIASVQIRALTYNGEAVVSEIQKFSVKDVLNDEVLT